jgi:hypothetical protein
MEKVQVLPIEVQKVIKGILEILDTEYRADRNKFVDGGYIILLREKLNKI